MEHQIDPLAQFVNHGLLPFSGRENECRILENFAASLGGIDSLQIVLVSGEAGIGKSRLFDEVMTKLSMNETTVIRVKLHPDTSHVLPQLLAEALWRNSQIRSILRREPDPTLLSVLHSLRRLLHLRRILLVLEDIHLIDSEHVTGLTELITALSTEPLGILCSARPLEQAIRGVLEPYLVETVDLSGLNYETILRIWRILFKSENSSDDLIQRLIDKTTGNPLALRLALRTGIQTVPVDPNSSGSFVQLFLNPVKLEGSLEATVQLLAQGMIAHLNEQGRTWAEELAGLGEVFSREAALVLLDHGKEALSYLKAKGVIMESVSRSSGLQSRGAHTTPYVFTHTLLHNHFLEAKRFDVDGFLRVLSSGTPVYSLVPFEHLIHSQTLRITNTSDVNSAVREIGTILTSIIRTSSIGATKTILQALQRLVELVPQDQLQLEQYAELRLILLYYRMVDFNITKNSPADERQQRYLRLLNEFNETVQIITHEDFIHLRVLGYCLELEFRCHVYNTWDADTSRLWKTLQQTIEDYPRTQFNIEYLMTLSSILSTLYFIHVLNPTIEDIVLVVHHVQKQVASISMTTDRQVKKALLTKIYPQLIVFSSTPEEIEISNALFFTILASTEYEDRNTNLKLSTYAKDRLDVEITFDIVRQSLKELTNVPVDTPKMMMISYYHSLLFITNHPREVLLNEVRAFSDSITMKSFSRHLMIDFHRQHGLLSCELEYADDVNHALGRQKGAYEKFLIELLYQFQLGSLDNNIPYLRSLYDSHIEADQHVFIALHNWTLDNLLPFFSFVLKGSDSDSPQNFDPLLIQFFDNLYPEMDTLIDLQTVMVLLAHAERMNLVRLTPALKSQLRMAMFRIMEWLIATKRIIFTRVFTHHFQQFFENGELDNWNQRIQIALDEQCKRMGLSDDHAGRRKHVTMIGKIGLYLDGSEEFRPIKGSRLKLVLGLMALNETLPKSLSKDEFYRIAAGDDVDPETRTNTMKVTVYQLRKLLGKDAILQDGGIPRINNQVLQLDIVDIWYQLLNVERDFNRGDLNSARNGLLNLFRIQDGNVLYPTLYEPIFEHARDDIESRIHIAVLNLTRKLIHEGDYEYCETILRRSLQIMPGDEELDELLQQTLRLQGRNVEAFLLKTSAQDC